MLSFAAGFLPAQKNGDDCMAWLRKVYSSMEQNYHPSGDKAFYFSYSVNTQMKDGSYEMSAELFSNNKKSWFISKEVEVYQDNSTTVSILPSRKMIYISDFTGKEKKEAQLKQLSFIQDTLFSLSKVTFCERVKTEDQKEYKKLTLKLSAEGRKLFKVETMDFYVDEKKEQLKEVYVKYASGHTMKEMTVKFNEMKIVAHAEKLEGNLLSQVIDGNGNPKVAYKDYKITDNRSRKTTLKSN